MYKQKGFTLVELLIVISLIAILSVGVLATINPIEQRNKASDANTSNDAGEVLNAYERYYTNSEKYPWSAITSTITNDATYFSRSNYIGFGLCGTTVAGAIDTAACSGYKQPGSLIDSQELKDSFLEKKYGLLTTDVDYKFYKMLYLVKAASTEGNSIYVCYIPQAKANRASTNSLKDLAVDANGRPTKKADTALGGTDGTNAYFNATGGPSTYYDYSTAAKSLFKCVP